MSLTHVWAFGNPHWLAERLPASVPLSAAVFGKMSLEEREVFAQAAVEYLQERQSDGQKLLSCPNFVSSAFSTGTYSWVCVYSVKYSFDFLVK